MAPEAFPAPDRATRKWLREKRAEAMRDALSHKISRATSFHSTSAPRPSAAAAASTLSSSPRGPPPGTRPARGTATRCGPTARAPRPCARRLQPDAHGAQRRGELAEGRRRVGARAGHRARRRQEVEVRERRPARRRAPVRAPEHDPFPFLGSQRRDAVAKSSGVGFGIQRDGAGQARGELLCC